LSHFALWRELDHLWSTIQDHEHRLRAAEAAPDRSWEGAMRHHGWKVLLGLLYLLGSRLATGSWPVLDQVKAVALWLG
jgi:hypothetical protein